MKHKKLSTFILIALITFPLISCMKNQDIKTSKETKNKSTTEEIENIKSSNTKNIELENDNVFLFTLPHSKVAGNMAFMKDDNSDTYKTIHGNLYYLSYSDKLNLTLGAHDLNKLISSANSENPKINEGEFITTDSPSLYIQGAGHKDWELGVPYKLSKDKSAYAYTTTDLGLVYVDSNSVEKTIGTNVGIKTETSDYINERFFKLSDNGKFVGLNDGGVLKSYNAKKGETTDIDRDIQEFEMSPDGKKFIYTVPYDENVYIKNLENSTQRKFTPSEYLFDYKVYDDGSAVFIDSFEEDMMAGFVTYIDEKGKEYKIPSKVSCYEIFDDYLYIQKDEENLYYTDIDKKLCKFNLKSETLKVLANDVWDFEVAGENIYHTGSDKSIYKLSDSGKSKIIEENTEENLEYTPISYVDGENVISKSANNNLYFNDKKIASDVVHYVFYVDTIAYYKSDNSVHTYNINTRKTKLEFENFKNIEPIEDTGSEINGIYYGGQTLYEKSIY